MAAIQWRPEVNALTTPQSYRILFLPRSTVGTEELAARMAAALPSYSGEEFRAFLAVRNEIIRDCLLNGEQVTEENNFTYTLSFTGRLDSPDDPLPDVGTSLQVRAHASPPFVAAVRHAAQTERLPMEKKQPLLAAARDSLLGLRDVLNPAGALILTGDHLFFDQQEGTGQCLIEGTRSGRAVQTRLVKVEDNEIILMPEIPVQTNPWNNEYLISVSTHYSGHGSLRTGTYGRRLRTPLAVPGLSGETGILTGKAGSPYASIIGGTAEADALLRILAVFDLHQDCLFLSLADMQEQGSAGRPVRVDDRGDYTLPGFAGSPAAGLDIRVHSYAALKEMVRSDYGGLLTDILDIRDIAAPA